MRAALADDLAQAHTREAAALAATAAAAASGAAETREFGHEHGGALAVLGGHVGEFADVRFQRDPFSGAPPLLLATLRCLHG